MTAEHPALDSPWLLVPEVMTYARASRREVLDALKDGSLRGTQKSRGGKWRVHRDDVDAWLRGVPPAQINPQLVRGRRSA